jgi:hypothetical protein
MNALPEFPDIPDFLRVRPKDNQMPTPAFKPLVYSYTLLNNYDRVCPYQTFRRYVKKDLPFVETEAMRKGIEIHTAMEYRIGGKPLPQGMQHWEPFVAPLVERGAKAELKLGITAEGKPTGFFDKDVWCRGKADVVMINGVNAFLVDWKSGGSKYETSFEIELQAMMLKAANPHLVKIAGCYAWLGEDRMGTIHDLSDFNSTWAKTNNIAEQIQDDMASGEWEKRKGPLCGYCPCTDCENWYEAKPK